MDDIDHLLQQLRELGHDVWIAGPATLESVSLLQSAIGFEMPRSLKAMLATYGALGVYDDFLSGIIDNRPLTTSAGTIYGDTMLLREDPKVPREFWSICPHQDGAYCIDFNRPTHGGEFAIVNFEHGSVQHSEILTDSYWDFVRRWFLEGWAREPA